MTKGKNIGALAGVAYLIPSYFARFLKKAKNFSSKRIYFCQIKGKKEVYYEN